MTNQTLFAAALDLPRELRADLADRLLASLDGGERPETDRQWATEAEVRIEAFEKGEVGAVPADEVLEEVRSRLG